nr:MAG TPA: hypothetical protein [Caudoviricetes sp.]
MVYVFLLIPDVCLCAVSSPYSCINRDRSPCGILLCASVRV